MKLYFHPLSGNSRRALLVVEHLGLAVERVLVDLTKGEHKQEPHLHRNPNGRVPVLEDNGFWLWESRAIMQYLSDKSPSSLYPSELQARADVNRWLFWCAQHMQPAVGILVFERFVKAVSGRGEPDPVEIERGEALFAQWAPVLDAHVANRTWVSGDTITLADYSLASSFALAGPAKLPVDDHPHLRAWLGRVQEQPAWQRTSPPAPKR